MSKWDFIKENYIDKGLKIFPVEKNGKKPLIENWQNDCSCDYFQVLYWYNSCPDCNWGLPCTPNNIFALDLDVHDLSKDGRYNFTKLLGDIYNIPFDVDLFAFCGDTKIQKTPSGGIHILFKSDDDLKNVANNSNVFNDYSGIDVRSDGYILVEPSTIECYGYTFLNDNDVQPMDNKLKQFIVNNANLKTEKNNQPYKKPTHVDVGDRDNQLFEYINDLYFKTRLDYDEILLLAEHFNDTVFEKPLSEKTVKYKVGKAFTKDRGRCLFIKLSE